MCCSLELFLLGKDAISAHLSVFENRASKWCQEPRTIVKSIFKRWVSKHMLHLLMGYDKPWANSRHPNPGPMVGSCEIFGNLLHFSKSKALHVNLNTGFTWELNEKIDKKAQYWKVNNSHYFKIFSLLSYPSATIMDKAENLDWVWSQPTCKHYGKTTFVTTGLYAVFPGALISLMCYSIVIKKYKVKCRFITSKSAFLYGGDYMTKLWSEHSHAML